MCTTRSPIPTTAFSALGATLDERIDQHVNMATETSMSRTAEQPAGNHYDKYGTRNPIARALVDGFLSSFDLLAQKAGPTGSALEIGCGEGELSMRLARAGWSVEGCDIAEPALEEARRRIAANGLTIPVSRADIREFPDRFTPVDLVVCCEVLEHLEDPEAAIAKAVGLARRHLLVSVPREPIWRAMNMARGKYLRDFGNTPGHLQHWSRRGFIALMGRHAEIIEVRSPVPWTQVLCRVG
jgi:2-polyprenyl-3-methyl-5-hydroxy-6-metoxy-1,4-benzoquinol methylase